MSVTGAAKINYSKLSTIIPGCITENYHHPRLTILIY